MNGRVLATLSRRLLWTCQPRRAAAPHRRRSGSSAARTRARHYLHYRHISDSSIIFRFATGFASTRLRLPLSSRRFPRVCGLVYDLFLHLPICISFVDCLWFLCCPFVLVPTESACVCLYLADDMNSISGRNEPAWPLPSLFRFYEQNWKKMDF